jgi:hypothetical protein
MKRYRIDNWSVYNRSLIQRGNITFWFSEEAVSKWYSKDHTCAKGRPKIFSDEAILCALLIRTVFHLPLRALEGFLHSLVQALGLDLEIPSYTQICRRARKLGKLLKRISHRRPVDIVFDSTGLKVYGEGEWKVRQHGASKRRIWRKLHIALDPNSHDIITMTLTDNGVGSGDGEVGRKMMQSLPRCIRKVFGDGAYDGIEFRRMVHRAGGEAIVPPPRDAVLRHESDPAVIRRDNAILEILGLGGDDDARRLWKKLSGYHSRSLGETAMYRIKQLTGSNLRSREWERQKVEASIKCLVVNKMAGLGMPKGKWMDAA